MGEKERVPLSEAARILGMSQQGVREHMKRNLFKVPIGYVTKLGSRYQYHIYRSMLSKHLGIDGNQTVSQTAGSRSKKVEADECVDQN